jgi:HAD superfamily hydrolase (TIGR01509 family)
MKFEAVIFDLDGTLIDSMGVWLQVDYEFLGKRNIPVPANLFEDVEGGNSFVEVAKYFKVKFQLDDSVESIMNEWTEMVEEHYRTDVKLKKDVLRLLKLLKKNNIKIGVGTSNSCHLAQTVLKANNVKDYFGSIVDGKNDIKGKPFPDIFLKAASELDVIPEKCLVIEDVLVGVQAAKNAGMTAYAIYDEHSKQNAVAMKDASDFYADNFAEIIAKLNLN